MSTNPYKAFIPYTVHPLIAGNPVLRLPNEMDHFMSTDPVGASWSTMGLVKTIDDDIVHELSSAAFLLVVQLNERILPGKVRDEKMQARKAKLEQLEGRKLSKKEYAELRDEVEMDLLPRAFIRRSQIPVFFMAPNLMLICTSSQKKADTVKALMMGLFEQLEPVQMATASDTVQRLTTLAKGGFLDGKDTDFSTTDCAVLKGSSKKTIRVKDREIDSAEVQSLIGFESNEYQVHEIGISAMQTDDVVESLRFTLNEHLVFKRCTMPDVKATQFKDDAHGFAYLCAQTYKHVLSDLVDAMGGMKPRPDSDKSTSASSDEDEL